MASPEIEQLQARMRALPNEAEGIDMVRALVDIADALAAIDDKLAATIESVESTEDSPDRGQLLRMPGAAAPPPPVQGEDPAARSGR
jgi:hypothetical protein